MGGACHPIRQMQVVGQGSAIKQALAQFVQRLHVVIDTAQQHRLIEQHAMLTQRQQGLPGGFIQFLGMIYMYHQYAAHATAMQQLQQGGVNAGWQYHRDTAVDTQAFYMGNLSYRLQQFCQSAIGQGQGVPAAQDQFTYGWGLAQILQRLTPTGAFCHGVGEMPAETVAAMDGTGPGRKQQRPSMILVQNAGYPGGGRLLQRVMHIADGGLVLFCPGPDLAQ